MTYNNGSWKHLKVWQESHLLVLDIYKLLKSYPKHEQYAIVDQIKRASYSIPANIVEGHSKNSNKDFSRFLYISRGSIEELRYFLLLSLDLSYVDNQTYNYFESRLEIISKMLNGLIKSLKT